MGALEHTAWEELLELMETEARRRRAPVYEFRKHVSTPFRALVAVLLSSRTRDETTLRAVKRLFRRAETPEALLALSEQELEELIYPVGFYRSKAKKLRELARVLLEKHGGKVPESFEELVRLPGIGRKSANVVLSGTFGKSAIAVDTHVHRISNRLGIVSTSSPEETEAQLHRLVPEELKPRLNLAFVAFGQTVCRPVKPLCGACPLAGVCPSSS
ncbi:MAG: endonuclease III [Euryarchaeota archaeon]|nr:endonuclease III [Euryarchaeota archaeon]